VATIATPIVFSTIIGGGRNKMPLNFIVLIYSIWVLLMSAPPRPLYLRLGLPRTSFRLMAHGVIAILALIAAAGR